MIKTEAFTSAREQFTCSDVIPTCPIELNTGSWFIWNTGYKGLIDTLKCSLHKFREYNKPAFMYIPFCVGHFSQQLVIIAFTKVEVGGSTMKSDILRHQGYHHALCYCEIIISIISALAQKDKSVTF